MSDMGENKKVDKLICEMEQLRLDLQKEKEKNKKKKEKEEKKLEKQVTPPLMLPSSSQGSGSQAQLSNQRTDIPKDIPDLRADTNFPPSKYLLWIKDVEAKLATNQPPSLLCTAI